MRLALDVTPLAGPRTGVGRFVEALVPALHAVGDAMDVRPYAISWRADRTDLPLDVSRLRWPASLVVQAWTRWPLPRAARATRGADVVHGTNFIAPPPRRPTVLTVHDCSFVTRRDECDNVVRAFGPIVRRRVAAGAWIHAPSEHVAAEARDLFGTDRVEVVHHGPPAAPEPAPLPPELAGRLGDRPFVLAVATREPRKNLIRLVGAFGAIAAAHPDLLLVLVGRPGRDSERVAGAIDRLEESARARVLVVGWLPDGQRATLLARAAALAYPSLDEGFGLPMLEAMAAGIPVVAARAGALPEVAGSAAVLVDPLDADAIAAAVDRVLGDRSCRERLVVAGRARVGEFSWADAATGLVSLYRRAIEGVAA